MKILWRYWKIHDSCGFQSRYLSARTIAEPETVFSKCLVCVSACGTKVLDLQDFLQNCTMKMAINEGKICHGQTIQDGLQRDTLTSNILINMYSKCGFLECARQVFDVMPERSLSSWNTMIGSYTHHRKEDDALDLFMQMQREGIQPSEFTLSSLLCACAAKSALSDTKQLHAFSLKTGLYTNAFVGTALLDVYAKCNLIMDAYQIFDKMPEKSSVTWSSMVAGFVQNDLYEEALMLFQRAQTHGLEQNQFILSAVLCACANLAAPIEGCQVHSVLVRTGFVSNLFVVSSLIDMYAKCGSIEEAYYVFSSAEKKNVVSWNTMISGFCRHVCSIEAMILFEKMQQMGMRPNEITYVSVLSACSHKGLVEEGKRYFELMVGQCIYPAILHYSCMVDILSRAGKLCEALDLIQRMPFEATASMWGSLLASCRIHGNLELAEIAAGCLFDIEPNNAGNHVLLSNIYAANKRWEEVSRARKLLKESGAKKEMGKSWIEVRHKLHTFVVGERNHPRIAEIYAKLDYLTEEVKKLGYKAETEHDLHDVEEVQKEEFLRHHSEKVALAFGLIDSPPGAPIRIKKNLRICWDCHSFIKLASQIIAMKIIVRDTNRFHHFGNGSCSCGDFW